MRRLLLILLISLLGINALAQNIIEQDPQNIDLSQQTPVLQDTTESFVDSTLLGKTILEAMPSNVKIIQPEALSIAMSDRINANQTRKFNGFRVRIYLGNKPSSRDESLKTLKRFSELYPDIPSYRTYESPNFRVLVGHFRTRAEADRFAAAIKSNFPSATVIRDRFKYPSIGTTSTAPRDSLYNAKIFL